jgi:hypothetical protein
VEEKCFIALTEEYQCFQTFFIKNAEAMYVHVFIPGKPGLPVLEEDLNVNVHDTKFMIFQ